MNSSVAFQDVTITRDGKQLYRNFSLEAESGSVTCLIAPSGSGKTTLLDFAAGVLDSRSAEVSGSVLFDGKTERPPVSFLFQEPRLIPSATVMQNIMIPLVNVMDKDTAQAKTRFFLDQVQLGTRMDAYPAELSGGERQRAAIARCFAYPAGILFMDEPFQSLDMRIKFHLEQLLEQLIRQEQKTVLFATHDVQEAVMLSDRIIVLEGTPVRVILDEESEGSPAPELEKRITALVVHSCK